MQKRNIALHILSIFLMLLVLTPPAVSSAPLVDNLHVSGDLGLAIFGEAAHREYIARAASLSTQAGLHWGAWGAYLHLEGAFWIAAEGSEEDEWTGVVNLGVGGEYRYANNLVRTSLAIGPSMLVTGTDIDEPGQVGVFIEIRPAGLRWHVDEHWQIGLDPLVFSLSRTGSGGDSSHRA